MNILRWFVRLPGYLCIGLIRYLYQYGIGYFLPKVCIYEPSCSHYMIQAIQSHGLIKGGAMGTWRICRCHPFAEGGWDPVPGYEYPENEEDD